MARPAANCSAARAATGFTGSRSSSDRDELADLLAAADLMVSPCSIETFGLSALEALASGTPLLGADRGGIGETIARSGAGATFRRRGRRRARRPGGGAPSRRSRVRWALPAAAMPRRTTGGTPCSTASSTSTGAFSAREPARLDSRRDPGTGGRRPAALGALCRARPSPRAARRARLARRVAARGPSRLRRLAPGSGRPRARRSCCTASVTTKLELPRGLADSVRAFGRTAREGEFLTLDAGGGARSNRARTRPAPRARSRAGGIRSPGMAREGRRAPGRRAGGTGIQRG